MSVCYPKDARMKWLFSALAISVALACGQTKPEPQDSGPAMCATPPSSCQTPVPSYAHDIAPVLDRTCNSTCHAPGVGPWPLNTYENVYDWGSIVAGDLEYCVMPPPDAGAGNGNLSDQERATILNWLGCGAPNN
jgi:hypothetical protein